MARELRDPHDERGLTFARNGREASRDSLWMLPLVVCISDSTTALTI